MCHWLCQCSGVCSTRPAWLLLAAANLGDRLINDRIDILGRGTLGLNVCRRLRTDSAQPLRASRRIFSSGSPLTLCTMSITR